MIDLEWPLHAILMLKSVFCVDFTGVYCLAFEQNYGKVFVVQTAIEVAYYAYTVAILYVQWSKEKNYVTSLVCGFLFIDCGHVHSVIYSSAFWGYQWACASDAMIYRRNDISLHRWRVREVLLRRAERLSIYRRKCVLMSCLGTKTDHVKLDCP